MDPFGQVIERYQMSPHVDDLVLVRFADIQDENIIMPVKPGLEFLDGHLMGGRLADSGINAAELLVVDELPDGWMVAADGTVRILLELQLTELELQCVKEDQPADQRITAVDDQLDGLNGLE